MKEVEPQKQPRMSFFLIILLVVILLNTFVFPAFTNYSIKEVDYGTFLRMVEEGKVSEAEIKENNIVFTSVEKGDQTYQTGAVDDPQLVERLYEADVKFTKIIPKESSPIVLFILSWVVPIILFIIIGRFIAKRMRNNMGDMRSTMTFGKSNAKIYIESETGKSFDDVAGQDEAKVALLEIVDFLHNPKKYKKIGAKMPKGVLLVGPPGTGKTLLAKALAGESKVPFFSISGSEFVEMFVGTGAARVRDLFQQAQEKAPCIVFIDELDAIGKSRDTGFPGTNDEREQTLNQLLAEMDGFDADQGVLILAATNRPEVLDKALLRPGRFDRRVPVELPDIKGREAILKVHAKGVTLHETVNLQAIARATPGASGADLANIINEGALRAVRQGRDAVLQDDLEASIEVVVAGYPRKNAVIPTQDKLKIAYHEIGHAIVAAKQSDSALVHKITIVPRTSGALGFTMQVEENENVLMTKEQALSKITTFMGGRAAEELVFDTVTSGAANDSERATQIARAMVTRFGMSDTFDMMTLETVNNPYLSGQTSLTVSAETAAKVDEETLKIIKTSHEQATQILKENMKKLHELAEYLFHNETMSGEEFTRMLEKK
ncbi:MAG TPA: ATP-dependent zinc metalloprotease FtsH [Cerasibacillus sp.]|uniref:ATP-dependent zinc metalloprotease FtsH n=1 Tax=Cerasibacillus sp. TaxID=2498711 RepID=UPI002F42D43A